VTEDVELSTTEDAEDTEVKSFMGSILRVLRVLCGGELPNATLILSDHRRVGLA
jgi:hypothetical protein